MRTVHPRKEFLQSPEGNAFAESIANPAFVAGVRAAVLEFSVSESRSQGWEDAARSHHYIKGAQDFAEYLLTFIDSDPKTPAQPANANLTWPTKQSLQQRPPKPAR